MPAPRDAPDVLCDTRPAASEPPFFTVAVPQHNRRRFVELCLASVLSQEFADFEVLVSDDHSSDDSSEVIPALLRGSGRAARYVRQPLNLGYDANVRYCLANARGRYVLILGNDDALAGRHTLASVRAQLESLRFPEIGVTNYRDWESGAISRRVDATAVLGQGPAAAAHYFRLFSFTSGLVFDRACAAAHDTSRWDGSIYYQIYLACRILAAGGRLGALDTVAVRDHIRLDGNLVPETYRVKYRDVPLRFSAKHTGLDSVARVTIDAIGPYVGEAERPRLVRRVFLQLLSITYPYWLFEYRQLANWGMGFGVARDLWPGKRLPEYKLPLADRMPVWLTYLAVTAVGLTFPASLFNRVRHRLAALVRRSRQRKFVS